MQLIISHGSDRATVQIADHQTQNQQTQSQNYPSASSHPRVTATWELVNGKLKCHLLIVKN